MPQYQKLLKDPKFGELRGRQADRHPARYHLGPGAAQLTGGGITARSKPTRARGRGLLAHHTQEQRAARTGQPVLLKLVRQDAKDKGKPEPVKTTDHRGVVVHVLGDDEGVAYGLVAGKLAISNSVKNLEQLIDRMVAMPAKIRRAAGSRKDRVRVARRAGGVERHSRRSKMPTRLPGDSPTWIDCGSLIPSGTGLPNKPDTGVIVLFGSWFQAIQKAPWLTASIRWSPTELGAAIELPVPKDGRAPAYKGYVPGSGKGAAPLIQPPGTIASLSLWRNMETFWESRADLFPPETVQGFAQLDTLAGQFFGGREFGTDVLGQFDPHWRLVVAQQDYAALKPQPDVKYPAFAIVAELDSADSDFGERFKMAFQAIIGISNVDGNQKKAAALELGLGGGRGHQDGDRPLHDPAARRPRRARPQPAV